MGESSLVGPRASEGRLEFVDGDLSGPCFTSGVEIIVGCEAAGSTDTKVGYPVDQKGWRGNDLVFQWIDQPKPTPVEPMVLDGVEFRCVLATVPRGGRLWALECRPLVTISQMF